MAGCSGGRTLVRAGLQPGRRSAVPPAQLVPTYDRGVPERDERPRYRPEPRSKAGAKPIILQPNWNGLCTIVLRRRIPRRLPLVAALYLMKVPFRTALVVVSVAFVSLVRAQAPAPARAQAALLDPYCVTCHSEKLKTGGLSLQGAAQPTRLELTDGLGPRLPSVHVPLDYFPSGRNLALTAPGSAKLN